MKAFVGYCLAVAVVIALLACGIVVTIDRMVANAAATATAERDAHWKAEIATSNAEVEQLKREKLETAIEVDLATRDKISDLENKNEALETANAALPNAGACGLSRGRVELLNK